MHRRKQLNIYQQISKYNIASPSTYAWYDPKSKTSYHVCIQCTHVAYMYVLLFSIFRVVSRHILSRITRASRSTRTCTSQEPTPRTGDRRYHVPQTYDTVTKLTVVCHQRSKAPVRRSTLDAQPETGNRIRCYYSIFPCPTSNLVCSS